MDVPGLLWSVGIAAAGHPRVAEGRIGGPTLAPRNLSYLFDCRLVARRRTPSMSESCRLMEDKRTRCAQDELFAFLPRAEVGLPNLRGICPVSVSGVLGLAFRSEEAVP
jgi:hypothetical protein